MVAPDQEFRECADDLNLIAAENLFCQCFWSAWMQIEQGKGSGQRNIRWIILELDRENVRGKWVCNPPG